MIRELLASFYTRELSEKSELYNVWTEEVRKEFLRRHTRLSIFQNPGEVVLRIFGDSRGEKYTIDAGSDEVTVRVVLTCFGIESEPDVGPGADHV